MLPCMCLSMYYLADVVRAPPAVVVGGRGAAAQAGSVEVSAKDGGQEYRYILPEARGSNRLLHTLAYR